MTVPEFDVIVIGGGIAGVSARGKPSRCAKGFSHRSRITIRLSRQWTVGGLLCARLWQRGGAVDDARQPGFL